MSKQYANNNKMEIQPSLKEPEHHSLPELPPHVEDIQEGEPMMIQDPPQEQRITKSSHKSSELQNEGQIMQSAPRHKFIKKKTEKLTRGKMAIARNQKIKAGAARKAHEEQTLQISPATAPPTPPFSNILSSIGYTFFTNHIDDHYLSRPSELHFQKVDKLLEPSELAMKSILNEIPEHQHRNPAVIQSYLELIENTKRIEGEEKVAYHKEQDNCKKIVLVSYKIREEEKQDVLQENSKQMEVEEVVEQNEEIGNIQEKMDIQIADTFEVTQDELKMMECRRKFMDKLEVKKDIYCQNIGKEMPTLNEVTKQLLFLNTYLSFKNKQNRTHIQHLKQSLNLSLQEKEPQPYEPIESKLIEIVFRKNIALALKRQQIDVLNYYKMRAADQQNRDFIPFTDHKKMIEFIKKKRPTKNKKPKAPIHSACTACFSSYSQQANAFSHCHDCANKIHKNCRVFIENDEYCKICIAKRNKNKKKQFVECVLCPNKGFTFTKVGNHNVHAFCILITGKYKIQSQKLKVSKEILDLTPSLPPCFICYKASHKLYKCTDSDLYCHSTCAFLHGYDMDFDRDNDILHIFSNTMSAEERFRQEFHRKYRLNHDGLVYRCFSIEEYRKQTNGTGGSNKNSSKFSSDSNKNDIVEGQGDEEEEELFHEEE